MVASVGMNPAWISIGDKNASGNYVVGAGRLDGIYVQTSSSLTLKVWDGLTAAGNVILGTTAAITAPVFVPIHADFQTGVFVTIGGSGTFSIYYQR